MLALLFLTFAAPNVIAGDPARIAPARIAIIPFKINARQDLSFLREGIVDMLSSRLAGKETVIVERTKTEAALPEISTPLNENSARTLGTRLGADYIVFGSITILGQSVSLDGKCADIHQKRETLTYFNQGQAIDEIIPHVNLFAAKINQEIFGRTIATPTLKAAPEASPEGSVERRGIYANPETLMQTERRAEEGSGPGYPGFERVVPETAGLSNAGFWKSRGFDLKINGLALGDVDGKKGLEIVFVTDGSLHIYSFQDGRLEKKGLIEAKRYQRFIGVDAADINENGRAEIFVTAVAGSGQKLDSFVLEWDGGAFLLVAEKQPWYFRVTEMPDVGKVLLGQKRTIKDLFLPTAYRLSWQAGQYEAEESIKLPKGTNIFGFAVGKIMADGEKTTVAFDADDHLRLFSQSGREHWISEKPYGGNVNFLSEDTQAGRGGSIDRFYLPQRICVRDVNGDGIDEVIVPSNQGEASRFLANYRRFSNGRIIVLGASGPGLSKTLHSSKVSGYVADFAVGDLDSDGKDEVIVAGVSSKGTLVTSGKSVIMAFPLVAPAGPQGQGLQN